MKACLGGVTERTSRNAVLDATAWATLFSGLALSCCGDGVSCRLPHHSAGALAERIPVVIGTLGCWPCSCFYEEVE